MKKDDFVKGLSQIFEYEVNLSSDLDLDSIDIMGLVVFLDENFSIQKTSKDLSEISSVNDIVDIIGSDKLTS